MSEQNVRFPKANAIQPIDLPGELLLIFPSLRRELDEFARNGNPEIRSSECLAALPELGVIIKPELGYAHEAPH